MQRVEERAGFVLSRGGASGRVLATIAGLALVGAVGCSTHSSPDEQITNEGPVAQIRNPIVRQSQGAITDNTCVTIQRGTAGTVADTYVSSGNPNNNYGNSTVEQDGITGAVDREVLFRFDLTGLVPTHGIVINSAQVTLSASGSASTAKVHRITAPWNEMSVTWNSFGQAFSPNVEAIFSTGTPTFSIQSLVQQWVNGKFPNYGIMLEQTGGQTVYKASESSSVADHPALRVCYSCQPGLGDCDGNFATGCEASLNTVANCGTCGNACSFANASGSCNTGTCAFVGSPGTELEFAL